MNKLPKEKQAGIIRCLIEGCSIRATARLNDVAINSVVKLLLDAGRACGDYHNEHVRGLHSKRVQVDEIWAFCRMKAKQAAKNGLEGVWGVGDIWTWTAIDADSKLMVSYSLGRRDYEAAVAFIDDLAERLTGRIQLTSDALKVYVTAVDEVFGRDIDYAVLQKVYASSQTGDTRYSPAKVVGVVEQRVTGKPDPKHISTSYVERSNLTWRMTNRRYTRLTNAFSKKVENHERSVSLTFMHYNFCRIHQTLRVTPAMEAGLTDHVWSIEELLDRIGISK
jgi:IS1 family transposase